MKSFTIELPREVADSIAQLAERCTEIDKERDGLTSHGALTVESLLAMLAEDARLMMVRPGSWEGAGMAALLTSHGYDI